jgi:uncharacterized protein
MAQPIVHFEITGRDPAALRECFGTLFGWTFDTSVSVSKEISQAGNYGFVNPVADGPALAGGIGGGAEYPGHTIFYVSVPDVDAALRLAETLGGKRVLGPAKRPECWPGRRPVHRPGRAFNRRGWPTVNMRRGGSDEPKRQRSRQR